MKKADTIAIIPARGGSKRIPKKNIKPFCGKPMIAYSIEKAIGTGLFSRVIVSTDDHEIAEIAVRFGAQVPFTRPGELADDFTVTMDVIRHAITWLNEHDREYSFACCIYPTAPFIREEDLKEGFERIQDDEVHFSFPVTTFASSIFRALKLTENNRLGMFWPEYLNTRTQDLPEAFHDTGQFYWGKTKSFLQSDSIFGEYTSPLIIPRHLAHDIDTPEDWRRAELMFQALYGSNVSP